MLNPKTQNFIILLTITLIISITPISAIEIGENFSVSDEYTYVQLYNDVQSSLIAFDDASNTELTPEQAEYLDTHMPQLQVKGEGMIDNLQDFFNYFLASSNETMTTNYSNKDKINQTKKQLGDVKTLNYTELVGNATGNSPLIAMDFVIVKITDLSGYKRNMNLIYLNSTHIILQSGSVVINCSQDDFNKLYVKSEDKKFDIIVVSSTDSRNGVLRKLWDAQDLALMNKESDLDTATKMMYVLIAGGGLALIVAGVMSMVNRVGQRGAQPVRGVALNALQGAVPVTEPETMPLVGQDAVHNSYDALSGEIAAVVPVVATKKDLGWKRAVGAVIAAGFIILTSGVVGHFLIPHAINKVRKELDNLQKYEPPIN